MTSRHCRILKPASWSNDECVNAPIQYYLTSRDVGLKQKWTPNHRIAKCAGLSRQAHYRVAVSTTAATEKSIISPGDADEFRLYLFEKYRAVSSIKRKKQSWAEDFAGCSIAETFSGAVVQQLLDFGKPMLGDSSQIRAFRKELADQAVGLFVGAALPGTVGLGKKHLQQGFRLQLPVFGKLLPVIQC
jgi:hypothetical protein